MWKLLDMRCRKREQRDEEAAQLLAKPNGEPGSQQAAAAAAAAAPPGPTSAQLRAEVAARCRPQLAGVVCAVLLLFPLLQAYLRPPELVWRCLLVLGLALLGHRVLTFRRWGDETPHVGGFCAWFCAMVVELLWENVMVWIVSATDARKYDDPPGLQDNGEILFNALAASNPLLGWLINGKWWSVLHFLGCVLALAFSVAWDQHPYSGFGIMARFSATVCLSRIIRVASFMCTVLPSPRPGCYRRRFPPPPDTWRGILAVGLKQLRGFGGCNDLVFSGHGAFWTLGPLVYQTYYPLALAPAAAGGRALRPVSALLWAALLQTSVRDVIDRQHYSVDMLLAVVVTAAVWDWTGWVYPEARPLPPRRPGGPPERPSALVLGLIALGLAAAGITVFVAKA